MTDSPPRPTGCVRPGPLGYDLVLARKFRAPIDDVWTSVTASESTARWFGPWEWTAEPGVGHQITLTMLFEESHPKTHATIDVCEPPRHLAMTTQDSYGSWKLELVLTQTGDTTELVFTQHIADPALAGDMGPGWEYYLDLLVAAREGGATPAFADYYPAQKDYYLTTARRDA